MEALRSRSVSIKVSPHVKEDGLAEIYQSMDTKMALLNRDGENFIRITPLVKCRDFLVDVYTFSKVERKFGIWGMEFDPDKEKPAYNELLLQCVFPKSARDTFEKQMDILHIIELANGYTPTECIPFEEKGAVLIGDKKWLQSCLLWSLYTSLIRCLCYDFGGEKDFVKAMRKRWKDCGENSNKETDAMLVSSVADETWTKILSNLDSIATKEFCGFDGKKADTHSIHHNSGFYSVFGTHRELSIQTVHQNKHWQFFKEQGWQLYTK